MYAGDAQVRTRVRRSRRDFSADGSGRPKRTLTSDKVVHLDEQAAGALASALADQPFKVRSVEEKPYTRRPYAPFRTTTMQQEASRKFGFGAARTMQVAQRLYEGGHITYMRTDSTTLSQTALTAARAQVLELYTRDLLADGRLVQVLPEWAEETYPLYAYHHSAQLVSAKVRAFLEFVVALTRE